MEKQIITFSANEQILKKTAGQERFADDVVGYIEAHFDLGDNWSGYDSIRAVWFTAFAQISTVLDQDGVCLVPPEVCHKKEVVNVNLVGSIVENNELTDRLTTYPIVAFIFDGNARVDGTETAPVTPSQFEQYVAIVEALVGSVKDIDHATLNADYTLTIYYSDGTSDTVGPIRGDQGPTGPTGNGIASIAKTGTSGTNPVVDTYTITYTNGQTTTFTVTNGVKGDTGNGIESIYLTGTSGAVKTYTILMTDGSTFEFEVTDGEVTQVVLDQTVEDIEADIYESTIVQVKSDTDPYFFRRTNDGNGCGHTCHDEIVGASVGWNQLITNGDFSDGSTGWDNNGQVGKCSLSVSDGVATVTALSVPTYFYEFAMSNNPSRFSFISGHAYLLMFKGKASKSLAARVRIPGVSNWNSKTANLTTSWNSFAILEKANASATANLTFNSKEPTDIAIGDTMSYTDIYMSDLTAMLGSTIADYIYTLEQGTAGAGVSFFRKYFSADYYPYSSGEIRSVEGLVSHDMVGFNQWDEEFVSWATLETFQNNSGSKNYIPVLPNTAYHITAEGYSIYTYGLRLAFYDANKSLISASVVYPSDGNFTTPSGSAYMKFGLQSQQYGSTYNHDICINISDASLNGQYKPYEKHSYPLDSTVTLRGLLKLEDGKLKADGDVYKSSGEVVRNFGTRAYQSGDESLADAITDGTNTVYKLTTPTTETATPYAKTQKVDPSGTEEYVSTGVVPIGHNTEYPMTLIDTMPKANGSYTMHLTVANGKRVVSWS